MARGRKLEEKQLKWALYAQVVREGGLKVPVIMRFSLIPGHCASPRSPHLVVLAAYEPSRMRRPIVSAR